MANHRDRPLIGWSEKTARVRGEIDKIACTSLTVMIRGERGTGKELVAREIHLKSNRPVPFIRMNCASLPETLVETELFGCEKGAFTGAEFRKGKFEQAHLGTLCLDEVGELSLAAQPKLLRVVETHEVDRVGGQRSIPVDFRLIVATNRNLEEMVRTDKFRPDLYDRLNMDSIWIPPLRERLDDIPVLVEYFIGAYVADARRAVAGAAQQVLDLFQTYSWPGNIRELENVVRRGVFTGLSETIRLEDLPFDFAQKTVAVPVKLGNYDQRMREYSRQLILAGLKHCGGNRTKAATLLELNRTKLHRLLKMHGLKGKPADSETQRAPMREESDWMQ